MKPAVFEYHAPEQVDEAVGLLADLGEDARVLAGGQSLIPMLAMRLTAFEHLIDIGRIESFRGISERDGSLWIGATTTEAAVGASSAVAATAPLLARATRFIGHSQIRNRGTIGGSIAHADPAAEYPAVALALDATMDVVSPNGRRTVPAADFFTGLWSSALAADEILAGITFPTWGTRSGFGVEEVARRHGDFAIAGAVVGVQLDSDDAISRCCIAMIGMGSTPERPRWLETELLGRAISEVDPHEIGELAVSRLEAIPGDLHGSAEYRRSVGAVSVRRAWQSAAAEASNG